MAWTYGWRGISILKALLVLVSSIFSLSSASGEEAAHAKRQEATAQGPAQGLYPAMFIFGDSLVDNGNNNFLTSLARADYPPNGIDFGSGWPTGRFCNGRTVSDYIGA